MLVTVLGVILLYAKGGEAVLARVAKGVGIYMCILVCQIRL